MKVIHKPQSVKVNKKKLKKLHFSNKSNLKVIMKGKLREIHQMKLLKGEMFQLIKH